jgi:hypothetical protein
MNAFDVTAPVISGLETWVWRVLQQATMPTESVVTVRLFSSSTAEVVERILQERFPMSSWFVYAYDADEPAIEFVLAQETIRFEKCNIAVSDDTISLYSVDQLDESSRKQWRDWFKAYEISPYYMMLPNAETSTLLPIWVAKAQQQFPQLIKDDWIDAFVSMAEMACTSVYQAQPELVQAAIGGVLLFGRLAGQPESELLRRIHEAIQSFSTLTSVTEESIRFIEQWVTHDYI